MKQRITIEQLNELSDVQKERLRSLWKPTIGDFFITSDVNMREQADEFHVIETYTDGSFEDWRFGTCHSKDECLPLLSSGQMIEIIGLMKTSDICSEFDSKASIDNIDGYLCDALWSAVKQSI